MGREIRRVPQGWVHPKETKPQFERGRGLQYVESYKPLFDRKYETAAAEWLDECAQWMKGEHRDQKDKSGDAEAFYWDWAGMPPAREDYVSYDPQTLGDDAWFAVYETVSEGTPVTPTFPTKAELVDYLATYGDFWDQNRGDGAWDRANAEKFVGSGWAPSMIAVVTKEGADIRMPRDGQF